MWTAGLGIPSPLHGVATHAHVAEISELPLRRVPAGRPTGRWQPRLPEELRVVMPRSSEDLWPVTEIVVHVRDGPSLRCQLPFMQDLDTLRAQVCQRAGLAATANFRMPTHCRAEVGCPLHVLLHVPCAHDLWNDPPEVPEHIYGIIDVRRLVGPPRPGYITLPLPDILDLAWIRRRLHDLMPEQPQAFAAFMGTAPHWPLCT